MTFEWKKKAVRHRFGGFKSAGIKYCDAKSMGNRELANAITIL